MTAVEDVRVYRPLELDGRRWSNGRKKKGENKREDRIVYANIVKVLYIIYRNIGVGVYNIKTIV